MSDIDSMIGSRDFVRLSSGNDYVAYFQHLDRVFPLLIRWYQKLVTGGNTEAAIVESFLQRLLYTVGILRLKSLFSQDNQLALDLNDSGFPHSSSIKELASDLALTAERSLRLPSRQVVQEMMLEEMLRRGEDPVTLLPKMAEIQFHDELDRDRLIFPFTPGSLAIVKNGKEEAGLVSCLFSWLCYDSGSNMPYVHILAFDYQGSESELREEYEHGDFLTVVERYGNRVPPMAVLASSIDQDLPHVFPKVLKRVRIGPVICPAFDELDSPDPLIEGIRQYGDPGDFALVLESEVIFSRGQVTDEPKGWFSRGRKKQILQIFAISDLDPKASDRQASQVQQLLMLPHAVLQQMAGNSDFETFYGGHHKVTYNPEGGIYAV